MKFLMKISIVVIALTTILSCNQNSDHKIIKLAHGLDINHSVHKAMEQMAKDLEEISDGQLSIKIYPNQQLGSERECLELLQIGSLDMTKVSAGVMENFAPKMKVLGLPFLFRDREHSFKVLDGPIGQGLLNEATKFWLKGLCYYDAGSRSFYTVDHPIETPEDLEGLKIRVMESATSMAMVKSLGGSPTPIAWGELYTALQQGVVDGAENNPPSFYLSRHYEVCKYYSIDEHTMLPDILVVGTHLWDKLNAQEQKWLQEAATRSVKHQRELWAISEQEALDAIKEAGVKVNYPDKAPFIESVQSIYEQYQNDPEINTLIQQIRNTK